MAHPPEVYTPAEVAAAARVPPHLVIRLIASGEVATVDGELLPHLEAARAGRWLRRNPLHPLRIAFGLSQLDRTIDDPPSRSRAAAMTAATHVLVLAVAILLTVASPGSTGSPIDPDGPALTRLVFVADPGPGGGGGGGGLRQPLPPPPAEREGRNRIDSPVPPREEPVAVEPPAEPERIRHREMPRIAAPLMEVAADSRDLRGLIESARALPGSRSQGAGRDGGVGTGAGRGVDEGQGAGLGPGSGAGTGGGPYRPGAGITPPAIRVEVQPDYTEEARRQRIEGEVLLEVIVLADGSIGSVRVLRSLGYGLDEAAIRAMRQWRFVPARRYDVPVDVVVAVAMEFRLR